MRLNRARDVLSQIQPMYLEIHLQVRKIPFLQEQMLELERKKERGTESDRNYYTRCCFNYLRY